MPLTTYYIDGLLRQASAEEARRYLGIGGPLIDLGSSVLQVGYVVQNTPLWNDVRLPMSSVRPGINAPPATSFVAGSLRAYQFTNNATQRLEFELQIPHGFNEGASLGIRLHVHWACGLANAAAGVVWKADVSVANLGSAFPAPTTYTSNPLVPTGAFHHMLSPIHTFTGYHESAVMVGNVYRDSTDAYTGDDVFGLSLDAHYPFQKAGSVAEAGD